MSTDRLEPMPEDWTRALGIVAHPDDMEYGAASAVARWTEHGKDVQDAERIWLVMLGAGAPALGEVRNASRVTQSQVAATVAALLGEDYVAAYPKAAAPLVPVRK